MLRARLKQGQKVAYVSDAGTPGISDPGTRLVAHVRTQGCTIESVPGASSLTAALSVAGVQTDEFVFLGFLPHKKGRQTLLKQIASTERTVVLFESTHRILKLLQELQEHSGEQSKIVLARELTKLHEEVLTGTPAELFEILTNDPQKQKGEFVVVVASQK
jgi:16S rRNA (cytidine1402-2'-O)-methyltransferase